MQNHGLAVGLGFETAAVTVPEGAEWYEDSAYADMAAVADFANWRFAVTEVALGSVPGATAAQLKVKREATFDEFFAFTATSTTARTYTNQSGTLASDLAANAPRRDYRNSKQQLRLEDARTNLQIKSETLHSWLNLNAVTVTANVDAAPDGNTTADRLTESASSNTHLAQDTATTSFTSGTTYTMSCYFKAETATVVQLTFGSTAFGVNAYANFNLSNGTLGTVGSAATATITSVGSGWYRCTVTAPATVTTATIMTNIIFVNNNTSSARLPTYLGTGTTLLAWGAQVEAGAFASDYIATSAAAVTRAIETCRLSPLLEAVLQRSAGSVVARCDLTNTSTAGGKKIIGVDGTNTLISTGAAVLTNIVSQQPTQLTATIGGGANYTDPLGAAIGFDGSGRSLVANGGTVGSDANTAPTRTTIYLGRSTTLDGTNLYGDGLYDFVGISPERLSNATLQALAVAA